MLRLKEQQLENNLIRTKHEKACVTLEEERTRLRDVSSRLRFTTEERKQLLDQLMDKTAQAEAAEAKCEALEEYSLTTARAEREKGEAEARRLLRDAEHEQRRLQGEAQSFGERQGAWHLEREHLHEHLRAAAATEVRLQQEMDCLRESVAHEQQLTNKLQDQVINLDQKEVCAQNWAFFKFTARLNQEEKKGAGCQAVTRPIRSSSNNCVAPFFHIAANRLGSRLLLRIGSGAGRGAAGTGFRPAAAGAD